MSGFMEHLLHRRQFVIGPEPIKYRENWKSVKLDQSCYLSHCPTLPVKTVTDVNGNPWRLIGIAVQTDPDRPDPTDEIEGTAPSEAPERPSSAR